MNKMADWLVDNKDKIENGMQIMGQASEMLAATVGQLHPILEAVFNLSAELLSNPDSQEAKYLTQQLERTNEMLDGISDEMDTIALELQKTAMNRENFHQEVRIISQYEHFQEFVNAKPKYRKTRMEKFLKHYEYTNIDLNLDALYHAVTGENFSEQPMLETVVTTRQRSRREVEDFCARLKKLFVVGIIAVMGYTALKEGVVGENIVKKWQVRMEEVEKRMKAAVDECKEKFPEQAKSDMEHLLQKDPATVDTEFIKTLLEPLAKKYDWVRWSIRIFRDREKIFFFNWLAGKKHHGSGGTNWFDILTKNNIKVVFSFCVDPKSVNKSQIREAVEQQKLKGDMMAVSLALRTSFPDCLVHAVSHYKEVVEADNFDVECHYFGKHKGAYLCIHPE